MSRPPLTNRRDASGRVPTMKGCLKSPMPSPTGLGSCQPRKSVAFGEEIYEEVYFADVWDRTPTEPARKLTYQDLLELKEIQRSLPRAQQLPDFISGKPPSQFLDNVPIGLLPLLSETSSPPSPSSTTSISSSVTPSTPSWGFAPPTPKRWPPPPSTSWVPPHMQHLLPKRPPPVTNKPTFSFLPLLETPPSSATPSPYSSQPTSRSPSPDHDHHSDNSQDPPTPSLTSASLESSPISSRASSSSPEPAFLSLADTDYDDRGRPHSYTNRPLTWSSSPPPLSPTTAWHAFPDRMNKSRMPSISPQRSDTSSSSEHNTSTRRKNVMILNGIEISLDDDEGEEDADDDSISETSTPSMSPCSLPKMTMNAIPRPTAHSIPSKHACTPSSPRRCSMSLHPPCQNRAPRNVGYADAASPWAG